MAKVAQPHVRLVGSPSAAGPTPEALRTEDPGPSARPRSEVVAAVDLGSNSFHLLVARFGPGGDLQVIDRLKQPVRLGGGLTERGRLRKATAEVALACLAQMGERLRAVPPDSVRAVGTNTLRQLKDGGAFLAQANRALGHEIEVVSGREEARLIWLGASHDQTTDERRLLVDIGGGSTELIVGRGPEIQALDSLAMGSVSWSMRHFPRGVITAERMRKAVEAANVELEAVERRFREAGWATAMGSSGTVKSIERILIDSGLSPTGVTAGGLQRLRAALIKAGSVARLELPGLADDRRPVLVGGVAILSAVFATLGIERMSYSDSALREGLLYELLGRRKDSDIRVETVDRVAGRFGVDTEQARRVEVTALALFDQVASAWELRPEEHRPLLSWAARLHEVGIFVAFSGYHKHGAYILAQAELPGFSRQSQGALAALVLGHRGKLDLERMRLWYPNLGPAALRLAVLLRLAARLHRSRSPTRAMEPGLTVVPEGLCMRVPGGFLDVHPLTRADLAEEEAELKAVGIRLIVE